jgi:hypothetical protein
MSWVDAANPCDGIEEELGARFYDLQAQFVDGEKSGAVTVKEWELGA